MKIAQQPILIFAALALMASAAEFSPSRPQESDQAIAAANRLIDSVGGRTVWAKARSLYVKELAFPRRIQGPVTAEFWRDLEQPAYRSHLTGPGLDRVEVRDEKRGWRVRNGQFSWMTQEQLRTEAAGWRQEPYTIYHRLARRDPALRLELTAENQLEIFDQSGHKLCWFVLDAAGAPIKWGNIFDGRVNEHLYGPVKRFGEFKMPAWGTSTDGSWRFEYVEIRLSEKPLALPAPPQ